jgi:citrate lyase beta subunit
MTDMNVRSVLYLAADRVANVDALKECRPDVVILDLEEAVIPSNAAAARAGLLSLYTIVAALVPTVVVRINSPAEEAGLLDCDVVATLPAEAVLLVPKPVNLLLLQQAHIRSALDRRLWCMGEEVEFAAQIEHLANAMPQLEVVVIGLKDLAQSADLAFDFDAPALRLEANLIRSASQAVGLKVVDGVTFGSIPEVKRMTERSVADGFDGITLIRATDTSIASSIFEANNLHPVGDTH